MTDPLGEALPPGAVRAQLPTMHDVARRAGVSPKTVSNVLSGRPHVRASTRYRVMAAVDELGYQVNAAARNLRTGRTGTIGLVLPDLGVPYFGELAAAVIRAAQEHGRRVLIEQTGSVRERELEVLAGFEHQIVEGLIVAPAAVGADESTHLGERMPLVMLHEPVLGEAAGYVTMQHYAGARAATEHLIGTGRTAIAAIGPHTHELAGGAGERYRGYRDALDAAGLPVDERRMLPARLWHRREGAAAAHRLLDSGVPVDALFCLDDTLALGALRALNAAGRSVPDDVAVVGFDDIEEAAYSAPALSTISSEREQTARAAVDMLVARIAGNTEPGIRTTSVHLVPRETSASPGPDRVAPPPPRDC